jgi:hypothetical protein
MASKGNTMNVPKTPDHKLIGALRILANDAPPADTLRPNVSPASIVAVALLNEVADRLAELTQPQPIETAPRDGTEINVFGGRLPTLNGEASILNDTPCGTRASWLDAKICEPSGWVGDNWQQVLDPTHWLPCVKVDPASLGGQEDEG